MSTTIDLGTVGFKSIETTGEMSAGSNVLNIVASAGFHVGDSVIVQIGGEAGGGMRGTTGVGGVYAATSSDPNLYYTNTDAPKSLVAHITAISADGKTITLDQAAAVSTSNAHVFYDNLSAWNAAVASTAADGVTLTIPSGNFAV